MSLEACIETADEAALAAEKNLHRAELCQALDLGGLTPSTALVEACAKHIEIHAMVRPRPGGFSYSETEIEIMISEIEHLAKAGAQGVVFGCLNSRGELDIPANSILVNTALDNGLSATFHRAFDHIPNKASALEDLIALGFTRVLTAGGEGKAHENCSQLEALAKTADGRIEIMAGSGVNASNAADLKNTGVDAIHFSIRQSTDELEQPGMGRKTAPNPDKIDRILISLEA